MSCNVLTNPSFETGTLDGWYGTSGSIATVVQGSIAYDGNYYLDVTGTAANPTASVAQDLYWLDETKTLDLTLWVRFENTISSATGHCEVSAYLGEDPTAGAIASDIIWDSDEWLRLTGSILPEERNTTLNLVGSCIELGNATIANVLFDDVVLSDC
ncbi:uncharacterized protein BP01DRAFT_352810 [Aspergillus saccharolyticus JOP 1030-1]|uniref:CBM-cenC domain-containing protein n=1 Tax=Aspergillus saccharolyticus JOP 1030-1 TaxID=1450539 RepID=A0A318ZYL8_9EURO|nr:hypothetical protein BP01DRAFT_352810 [Aspergillus saccharolyticus JOP 1030-1]PYH49290.1 hypothetical protein BP01DRAFT_352810 [Aspergillus saccharolyticus JOP 1030-1]